jgi:transcriptional regulator with XRE-family HTH domain
MQIHEKLKVMRQFKGWTQEELAEKLNWAVNSYAKIERGEASIKLEKLKKIAEVMGVEMEELVNSNDKTVFNFAENCNPTNLTQGYILLTETQCAHELEKSYLIIELKDKEIAMQQREIEQLNKMIALLEKE